MIKLVEAVPLTVFLIFLRVMDTSVPGNWRLPFILSGLAAVAAVGVFLYKKMIFNRVLLGINLYLISGGLAFVTRQWWLNRIYNDLGASGMLLWISAVGGISLLFSRRGFVGAAEGRPKRIRKYSLYLLAVSCCAFGLSYGFRGNKILAEIIPFVGLFIALGVCRSKAETGRSAP